MEDELLKFVDFQILGTYYTSHSLIFFASVNDSKWRIPVEYMILSKKGDITPRFIENDHINRLIIAKTLNYNISSLYQL